VSIVGSEIGKSSTPGVELLWKRQGSSTPGVELGVRVVRIGLLGYGRIGQAVASLAEGQMPIPLGQLGF